MALGNDTFSSFAGAASDLLKGNATADQFTLSGQATAQSLRLGANASAMKIKMDAQTTADSLRLKATGDLTEATNYDLASTLAGENAQYTAESTAISLVQADRQNYMRVGAIKAGQAASGGTLSGSGLDVLRSSASQGALDRAMKSQQGAITEAGYTEQSKAYSNLAGYARFAATTENSMADKALTNADRLAAQTIADAEAEAATAESNASRNADNASGLGAIGAIGKIASGIFSFL